MNFIMNINLSDRWLEVLKSPLKHTQNAEECIIAEEQSSKKHSWTTENLNTRRHVALYIIILLLCLVVFYILNMLKVKAK